MYWLTRDGVSVDPSAIGGRCGERDRAHIFQHSQDGELVPTSLLHAKGGGRIGAFRSRTLRLGVDHSHDDLHTAHYLETQARPPRDLLKKFRQAAHMFRRNRKNKLNPTFTT